MDVGPSETRPVSSSSHPVDPGSFAPGTMLADRYRIVALVGRGGMGEVHRSDDLRLGQTVALKFLPATLAADPAARERLLAEVRSARHRLLDLPGGGPTNFIWRSLDSGRLFVQAQIDMLLWTLMSTLSILATLFVIRLIVRRADVAWVVFSTLFVGMGYLVLQVTRPPTISLLLLLGVAAVFSLMLVWVLWRHGALAFVVAWLVGVVVQSAPWTLDTTRWYWWRGWFVVAVVAGLAFWGFRNALGRQSMLPAGALDA